MNKNLANDIINEKMLKVRECINALKFAKNAIPMAEEDRPSHADMVQIHSFLTVLTDSLDSAVDIACEDMAEYFKSWGA